MKKPLIYTLIIFIIILSFSACGSPEADTSETSNGTSATTTNNNTTNTNSSSETASSTTKEESTSSNSTPTYVIDNDVIVDTDDFKVTFATMEDDKIWGPTIRVLCENKTTDTNLAFSADDVSVNGCMIDPLFYCSVAAGKKAIEEMNFPFSSLEENNISSVDQIEFTLRIHDDDNWMADDYIKEVFTVFPTGLTAEQVVKPVRPSSSNEVVFCDNDNFSFVIIEPFEDSIWGYSLLYYVENKTSSSMTFSWEDVSVNGFMVDPFWATSVAPEKCKVGSISFSSSSFEENDIDEVSEIEFRLSVSNGDDWMADKYIDKVFEYSPK